MPIKFTPAQYKNNIDPSAPPRYFTRATDLRRVDLEELAQSISEGGTTVGKADVYAVLIALTDELARRLPDGQSIHLGDLGIFILSSKAILSQQQTKFVPRALPKQMSASRQANV